MTSIVIIDDNPDYCSAIESIVSSFGYDAQSLNDPNEAIHFVSNNADNIGMIFLDIEFGNEYDIDGIDLLGQFRKEQPRIPVVMISGKGTIETAVKATKLGAVNFIEKSVVSKDKIKEVLESSLGSIDEIPESEEIKKFLSQNGLIGSGKAMLEVGDSIMRFGKTDLNVLITGETGTGKKLVAKAIHKISRRNKFSFVTVDIPNIPKELFQSELFGHTKGAFSGATENKKGLFHEANKGSLFLDEIGDMTLELQSNLFLPIEERSIRKVGSVQSEEVDIRFISATDKELLQSIKDGSFREQLYHRLRECQIHIPPLRERREDIPDIVAYYVKSHNDKFDEKKVMPQSSVTFLQEQDWNGNVRELSSVIKVALQTSKGEEIEIGEIHKILSTTGSTIKQIGSEPMISMSGTLKEDIQKTDKKKIEATLKNCNGNVSKSAAILGISRETLHNKIRKYDINVQQYRIKSNRKKS